MDLKENKEIREILENVKIGMIDYIVPGETEYTESDVEKCISIMNNFLSEISNSDSREIGMQSVKKVVIELNKLNEECEYEIIETDQREQLAEIIIIAGSLKGYNNKNEDITEEWRDW
ncbi:hypothetical protein [Tenacibaculum sp. 190524A05c]|uniref:hypothetical protein n=1 Tax=Tenacibaculum platacis TaxID=3137852 RepID=UPI0031FA9E7F